MTINANSLDPGERLLWHGQPNAPWFSERNFRLSSRIGLALVALAVAILFLQYMADRATPDSRGILAVLAIIGAFLACRPFWVGRDLRRTRYALTDRRAIIERPGTLLRNRDSIPYSEIGRIEVRERGFDNIIKFGDVIFRDYVVQTDEGPQNTRGGFIAIAEVQRIGQLLRTQVEAARGDTLAQVAPNTWGFPYTGRASPPSSDL